MNKTEMMAKIANARTERENAQIAKANYIENKVAYYRAKIKALAPRIKDLLDVAREMQRNGIDLGENDAPSHACSKMPEFETEWWWHRLGFFCEDRNCRPVRRKLAYGIGFMGGGYDGRDFIVYPDGEVDFGFDKWNCTAEHIEYRLRSKAASFLEEFDDFEKRFYAYVESL